VKREDLAKSLTTATAELEAVKKQLAERSVTLAEKDAEATKSNEALEATKTELATTKEALTKAQPEAEKDKARKAYQVTSKFDLALTLNKKADEKDMAQAFAAFAAGK
jgi:peptidoglycan hydrolase CwlO-like protein